MMLASWHYFDYLTKITLIISFWRFTRISKISFVSSNFFNTPVTYFLKYFRATFREILTSGSWEIGVFSKKLAIFRLATHAHLSGFLAFSPQSPRSFRPVAEIESSLVRSDFLWVCADYLFRILNQSDLPDLKGSPWFADIRCWVDGQSSQSLPQARRIVGSGDENGLLASLLFRAGRVQNINPLRGQVHGPDLSNCEPVCTGTMEPVCLIAGSRLHVSMWVNCASLPCTIFVSLARAHERLHVQ